MAERTDDAPPVELFIFLRTHPIRNDNCGLTEDEFRYFFENLSWIHTVMANYFKFAESKKEMEGYIKAMRDSILGAVGMSKAKRKRIIEQLDALESCQRSIKKGEPEGMKENVDEIIRILFHEVNGEDSGRKQTDKQTKQHPPVKPPTAYEWRPLPSSQQPHPLSQRVILPPQGPAPPIPPQLPPRSPDDGEHVYTVPYSDGYQRGRSESARSAASHRSSSSQYVNSPGAAGSLSQSPQSPQYLSLRGSSTAASPASQNSQSDPIARVRSSSSQSHDYASLKDSPNSPLRVHSPKSRKPQAPDGALSPTQRRKLPPLPPQDRQPPLPLPPLQTGELHPLTRPGATDEDPDGNYLLTRYQIERRKEMKRLAEQFEKEQREKAKDDADDTDYADIDSDDYATLNEQLVTSRRSTDNSDDAQDTRHVPRHRTNDLNDTSNLYKMKESFNKQTRQKSWASERSQSQGLPDYAQMASVPVSPVSSPQSQESAAYMSMRVTRESEEDDYELPQAPQVPNVPRNDYETDEDDYEEPQVPQVPQVTQLPQLPRKSSGNSTSSSEVQFPVGFESSLPVQYTKSSRAVPAAPAPVIFPPGFQPRPPTPTQQAMLTRHQAPSQTRLATPSQQGVASMFPTPSPQSADRTYDPDSLSLSTGNVITTQPTATRAGAISPSKIFQQPDLRNLPPPFAAPTLPTETRPPSSGSPPSPPKSQPPQLQPPSLRYIQNEETPRRPQSLAPSWKMTQDYEEPDDGEHIYEDLDASYAIGGRAAGGPRTSAHDLPTAPDPLGIALPFENPMSRGKSTDRVKPPPVSGSGNITTQTKTRKMRKVSQSLDGHVTAGLAVHYSARRPPPSPSLSVSSRAPLVPGSPSPSRHSVASSRSSSQYDVIHDGDDVVTIQPLLLPLPPESVSTEGEESGFSWPCCRK